MSHSSIPKGLTKKSIDYKNQTIVFKDSTNDFIESLNQKLPIKLSDKEEFINKIHNRYPYVKKTTIALIVKAMFETMRTMLILGYIFSFRKVFFNFRLNLIKTKNNLTYPIIKLLTPNKIKNHES